MKLGWGEFKAIGLWAPIFAVLFSAQASAGHRPTAGDEDPFPLQCVDFSGKWKSDSGTRYNIGQRHCDFLQIAMTFGTDQVSLTIVPDNRIHAMPGSGGMVRHRWNSQVKGTILEAHMSYPDGTARVTEVITYELVNPNLLLETTYRTIECGDSRPRHETEQEVFRRVLGSGPIGK